MIESWIIFRTPEFPFIVRKCYGFGDTRVFARGATWAMTIDEARGLVPASRGLRRMLSGEPDVEEMWIAQAAIDAIRKRLSAR